jgi:hypothetical protein
MPRRIDHLVVAVRDLDAASSLYQRLGFQVGARNRHAWGTENRLVQFGSSFIELITIGEGATIAPHADKSFSFGAFLRDYLAQREGLAMLVLDSDDAKADAGVFAQKGIGSFEPFHFERRGRRPDGSPTQVAFTLAFARDAAAVQAAFFVCEHHFPENFWNPAFQRHDNKAADIAAVAFVAPDPEQHAAFLAAFTGADPERVVDRDLSFPLRGARLHVMTPDDAAEVFGSVEVDPAEPSLAAFSVRVEDMGRQGRWLDAAEVPYQHIGSRIVVPASAAFGVAIAFEAT